MHDFFVCCCCCFAIIIIKCSLFPAAGVSQSRRPAHRGRTMLIVGTQRRPPASTFIVCPPLRRFFPFCTPAETPWHFHICRNCQGVLAGSFSFMSVRIMFDVSALFSSRITWVRPCNSLVSHTAGLEPPLLFLLPFYPHPMPSVPSSTLEAAFMLFSH